MAAFSLTPKAVPQIETRHRRIKTAIPNPATLPVIEELMRCEPASMNSELPVVWDRAKAYQVFDASGNCWIDFTSTIFVANVGHSHPQVVKAITDMAGRSLLNAYYYPTEIRSRLAKKILGLVPPGLNKVLFLSTGAETTEVAAKITMMHGRKISPEKDIVVAFEGSFHGKTMGAQTLGGKPGGKAWIKYFHPRVVHLDYPYPWVLSEMKMTGAQFFSHSLQRLSEKGVKLEEIAGFIAEPYQGWCAVFFPVDYMAAMREWCTKHQALLAFDEVQAGFGRTGKMFGFEHFGVTPDIICCAKALSSSIPVSAVIASAKVLDVDPSLNSTHGGNPIGMAASMASIEVLQSENLISESARKGELVKAELEKWRKDRPEYVCEIFGAGLLWGIFIRDPKTKKLDIDLVDRIIEKGMQKGLLSIRTCSGTLKLGPPLIIPDDALVEGIRILRESLDECVTEGS